MKEEFLVPKLRLGTHGAKLRFAPCRGRYRRRLGKRSFRTCVPKRNLGTRG
jgi:hypothetical protein